MKSFVILLFIAGILFILYSFFSDRLELGGPSLPVISINGEKIFVEIADTPNERFRGLSKRTSLPSSRGMLFVFEEPDRYSFVMRNMFLGLDFIWINEEWEIVAIDPEIPENYPDTLRPPEPIMYVLEVNSGWARRHGIKVGDVVDTSLLNP